MTAVDAIANLMRQLEDQLVVCMRCGMCQAVCPLFAETGRESDVARGKLALLDGLMQEMLKDPEGAYERLNKCLLCGSCAANCPSGVKVLDIFIQARAILTGYLGLSPAKRALLRGMLKHPALFDRLAEWGAVMQKALTRPVNEVVGTSCARVVSPLIGDRHFTALAARPFHRSVPFLDTPAGRSGLRVAFFTGCLIDKVFPSVARSALRVLDHHGVGVFLPRGQGCCGIPSVSSGDMDSFQGLLRHNLALLAGGRFDFLVTACATCTATIKEIWPLMAPEAEREAVLAISRKTLDIHQLLVSHVGLDTGADMPAAEPATVTYHDPCHLKKSLDVVAEPREVLAACPGYRLKEMTESDWCCGMGGSFNIQHYDISARIGRRKKDHIVSTGCSTVTTGCPACMIQISDALSRAGERIRVRHPVELYAERLG